MPGMSAAASGPPLVPSLATTGPNEAAQGIAEIVSGAAPQFSGVIKPEVAAAVAATFGFPLILMLAVAIFVIVQNRVDSRDPKLRLAPLTALDTVIPFREEAAL